MLADTRAHAANTAVQGTGSDAGGGALTALFDRLYAQDLLRGHDERHKHARHGRRLRTHGSATARQLPPQKCAAHEGSTSLARARAHGGQDNTSKRLIYLLFNNPFNLFKLRFNVFKTFIIYIDLKYLLVFERRALRNFPKYNVVNTCVREVNARLGHTAQDNLSRACRVYRESIGRLSRAYREPMIECAHLGHAAGAPR